jgi:hypothetical protein
MADQSDIADVFSAVLFQLMNSPSIMYADLVDWQSLQYSTKILTH